MNKSVAALLLALCVLIAGCSAAQPPAAQSSASQSAGPVPIIIKQEGPASFWSALLGGGIAGGLLALLGNWTLEINRRRRDFLDSQLRELYGPLCFFASCNEQINSHTSKIQQAADKEYSGPVASPARTNDINATIATQNRYSEQTAANNQRMLGILRDHYALIDPGDVEVLIEFRMDRLRQEVEFGDTAGPKLPLEIHNHLGSIYTLRPGFAKVIGDRFWEKRRERDRLINWPKWLRRLMEWVTWPCKKG